MAYPTLTDMFPLGSTLGKYRNWLQLSPTPFLATPEQNSPNPTTDMGGNEGKGGERWTFFGTRSVVHKSPTDPGSESSTGGTFIPTGTSEVFHIIIDKTTGVNLIKILLKKIKTLRVLGHDVSHHA